MAASSSSSPQWNFYQILRRQERTSDSLDECEEDDIITAIQFDKRGHYLATGDEGGRVAIFERDDRKNVTSYPRKFLEELDSVPEQRPKFRFKTQFKSHELEVDKYSIAIISERINKVSWCVAHHGLLLLLSANDKKVKLWTIKESEQVVPLGPPSFLSSENVLLSSANGDHLEWTPENLFQEEYEIAGTGNTLRTRCKKVYEQEEGSGCIHSISNNTDGQSFISADEYEINLRYLEVSDRSFTLINMKPPVPEPDSEMITSAVFHPVHCYLLAYGSSRGQVRVADMREAMRCDNIARLFLDPSLSDLIHPYDKRASGISDVNFLAYDGIGGKQLISRDYMNIKIWDMRMEDHPLATYRVHEHLRPRMPELYNDETMHDQFDCCSRRDGLCFATGSYSHRLKIFSTENDRVEDIKLDVIENIGNQEIMPILPNGTVRRSPIADYRGPEGMDQPGGDIDDTEFDSDAKLLRVAWHPTSNLVASAVDKNLIFYHV